MFDKLIDWLISILNDILPFFILRQYDNGLILRNGKYLKTIYPGFHWKIPFIDEYMKSHVVLTTYNLPPQSLITKDGKDIVVRGMIKYRVTDIKTFLLEVYEARDVISDITQAVIKNTIMTSTYEECRDTEIDNVITKKTRVETKKWGVETNQVTLTDIAVMRSFRIINDSQLNPNYT